jgi:hypothetical protein
MSAVDPAKPKKASLWPGVVLLCLLGVLIALQHYVYGTPISSLISEVGLAAAQCIGGLLVFVSGMGLYFFRCRWHYAYGFVEVIVGFLATIYVIGQAAGAASGRLTVGFGVAAALYVIVRGLDNMHRGMSPKDKESWERFFFGRKVDKKP